MEKRYTFSKNERLCKKKLIEQLFDSGRWLRSEHMRLVYFVHEDSTGDGSAQILFTVPKKIHRRAVKRNLLKRRMREAYRLNKPRFYEIIEPSCKQVLIGIVYSSTEITDFKTIQSQLTNLLFQVATRVDRM